MMAELDLSKGLNRFLPYTGRPKRKGEKITLYCDGKQKTTLKVPNWLPRLVLRVFTESEQKQIAFAQNYCNFCFSSCDWCFYKLIVVFIAPRNTLNIYKFNEFVVFIISFNM